MITDEEFLDMLHRLNDEEKISIFSQMILTEKWRGISDKLLKETEVSPITLKLHLR